MGKWVTPPTLPEDKYCRQILIPNSPEWVGTVSGALLPLIYKNSWEQSEGGITPEVASEAAFAMLNAYWETVCADTEFPTPYWDDETSVDDEATSEEQTWYGQVTNPTAPPGELTFVENAVIWLLAGFVLVAAAPTIIGAAPAAIFFRTVATRFTLAFNRGDIREIFRVVIDAVDYGTVDTDGLAVGDIIELDVNGIAEAPTHDILIVRTTP